MMKKHFNGWKGFSNYDISIFWWSMKLYCALKNEDERTLNLQGIMDEMKRIDIVKKWFHFLCRKKLYRHALYRRETYMNYPEGVINACLSRHGGTSFGLSQEYHLDSSSDGSSLEMFIYHEDRLVMGFSQRQHMYEEEQYSSSLKISSAYA
eukprot:326483-Ditylum_brightwellii.AAC.1